MATIPMRLDWLWFLCYDLDDDNDAPKSGSANKKHISTTDDDIDLMLTQTIRAESNYVVEQQPVKM